MVQISCCADVEDHAQNFTRFHLIRRAEDPAPTVEPDKLSVAFALEHRPGTLVKALQSLAAAGVNLTRIESRPVPGQPWEYVFFVEFRFPDAATADAALNALREDARMVRELGRYKAAAASITSSDRKWPALKQHRDPTPGPWVDSNVQPLPV